MCRTGCASTACSCGAGCRRARTCTCAATPRQVTDLRVCAADRLWSWRSCRVGVGLAGLDRGPDLLARGQVEVGQGGRGDVGEGGDGAAEVDPYVVSVPFDALDARLPQVARAPVR